jgi:hypothetical protein
MRHTVLFNQQNTISRTSIQENKTKALPVPRKQAGATAKHSALQTVLLTKDNI